MATTQSQLRRQAVSHHVLNAAASWRQAMLHRQTPSLALVCCEENVTPDSKVRKFISTEPSAAKGRWLNTYAISPYEREIEEYHFYMERLRSCTARTATFREDGLGIWLKYDPNLA